MTLSDGYKADDVVVAERCAACRHRKDSHLRTTCVALLGDDTVCTCGGFVPSGRVARKREEVWHGVPSA